MVSHGGEILRISSMAGDSAYVLRLNKTKLLVLMGCIFADQSFFKKIQNQKFKTQFLDNTGGALSQVPSYSMHRFAALVSASTHTPSVLLKKVVLDSDTVSKTQL
jgi:hypothetical protein